MENLVCVTVYVLNDQNKFLLIHHRKLNRWVPPGGKVDPHEVPDEAAVRECFEETGVQVALIGELSPCEGGLMKPYGVQYNIITPGVKGHYDLIYLAKPVGSEVCIVAEREAYGIGWFSLDEIKHMDTFPSVIQWGEIFAKETS